MRRRDPSFPKNILARDQVCQECGSDSDLQAHHTILVSQGGSDELSNGIALCVNCHADRHPDVPRGLFTHHSEPAKYTKVKLSISLPEDMHECLKLRKRQDGIPVSVQIQRMIEDWLMDAAEAKVIADVPPQHRQTAEEFVRGGRVLVDPPAEYTTEAS